MGAAGGVVGGAGGGARGTGQRPGFTPIHIHTQSPPLTPPPPLKSGESGHGTHGRVLCGGCSKIGARCIARMYAPPPPKVPHQVPPNALVKSTDGNTQQRVPWGSSQFMIGLGESIQLRFSPSSQCRQPNRPQGPDSVNQPREPTTRFCIKQGGHNRTKQFEGPLPGRGVGSDKQAGASDSGRGHRALTEVAFGIGFINHPPPTLIDPRPS